ncbi:MAG TPA: efflux RND transporter periplasmic adaptor subunit [Bryobacteraceae bacterium]|nr:efflux RND transporter periplasmic adaptor subunit [Bryobacteraceae bacterium]
MSRYDQCTYPPRISADVEISTRDEGAAPTFVIGSASAGKYLMLGEAEREVIDLVDGERTIEAICEELARVNGVAPPIEVLSRYLGQLDRAGILAGERAGSTEQNRLYLRWSLFNPEGLFDRLLPLLRWIWTPEFFWASILLMAVAEFFVVLNAAEVFHYAAQALRTHYVSIFVTAWLIGVTHEFAHGMTSKAFGGRATEVGALLVYYCLPGLYCNVSGLHMIPQRSRRMWVIAAGIYWQLMIGAFAMLAWFAFQPETAPALILMIVVLGSVLELGFNANPLIKLDGYYFLSQWLKIPNLMDRSRACWRALFGATTDGPQGTSRERRILLAFGFFSFLYSVGLWVVIGWYASQYLMDWFGFAGILLTGLLVAIFAGRLVLRVFVRKGGFMVQHKRRFIPAAAAICFAGGLCMPWTASVGSYGALVAIPGREVIVRAPENGSLTAIYVQPGESLSRGAALGRMGNPDLEEQIAEVKTDLARVTADADRITGEKQVQQQDAMKAEWQLAQRRRELNEVDGEEQQIRTRMQSSGTDFIAASNPPAVSPQLPASIAPLESNVQELRAKLAEADRKLERQQLMFKSGLTAAAKVDEAETNRASLAFDVDAAMDRLKAALIEHRRRRTGIQSDVNVANSQLAEGRAQTASLDLQLEAAGRLRNALEDRLALLESKRARFALISPVAGTVFRDDLPRMSGQYFQRGAEICRIADTHQLIVQIQVPEQAFGDIAQGERVRVKARAFPNRTFQGRVSRIGGESELDPNGERSYRVELTIENADGLLKPGMTVFARIDFSRHPIAWLIGHKLKQALRPELWML